MNTDTQTSPGIGLLASKFAVLGGAIIDMVGTSGQRITAQISAGRLFRGWVPLGVNWLPIGGVSFDGVAIAAALGGGITKANIRVTLYDGDSGSPNPVYVATFGSCVLKYIRPTPQPADYDFDGGTSLHFGFVGIDSAERLIGAMGAATTYRLDASGNTIDTFTGFPGLFALTDPFYAGVPKPARYMLPVQAGVAPGVWPVTGWFTVPDGLLDDLYAVVAAGNIQLGVDDISPGDQFYDFTQGLASDVIDIPPVAPPIQPPPAIGPQYCTLDLWVWRQLQQFTGLTQNLNFPPAYQKALLLALALEMLGEYPEAAQRNNADELAADAEDALRDLEILNASDAVAVEPQI